MKPSIIDITVLFSLSNKAITLANFLRNISDKSIQQVQLSIYDCTNKEDVKSKLKNINVDFFDTTLATLNDSFSYILIKEEDADKLHLLDGKILANKVVMLLREYNEEQKDVSCLVYFERASILADQKLFFKDYNWKKIYFISFLESASDPQITKALHNMKNVANELTLNAHCELITGGGLKKRNINYYAHQVDANLIILSGKNFVTN